MNDNHGQLSSVLEREEDKLLACVHCGLCLEACPTYLHTGDENDSPRGRIYLMRAVEEKRLDVGAKTFERHINRCLGCRACEQACPAGVQYGQLLEAARADLLQAKARRKLPARLLHLALNHIWLSPARLRFAFASSRLARDTKLVRLLLGTRLLARLWPRLNFALALLDSSAPSLDNGAIHGEGRERLRGRAPASAPQRVCETPASESQRALIFKGCVMDGLFARVNRATQRVLEANGYAVAAPRSQVCCGALHAHAGDLEGARQLARRNIEAFADTAGAPIITNAGGCGAMLCAYDHLLAGDPGYAAQAQAFSARVRDISQQLAATGIRPGAKIGDVTITYDASCHLLYGQHASVEPLQMLKAIPDLKLVPLEGSERCCGGAGVYNLMETALSEKVLGEKLDHIKATGATVVATGNPGCHMQIAAGARLLAGMHGLIVCHPVELLDESYRRAGFYHRDA